MKLLIDESLSARVAALLVAAGHDAIHVGKLDILGAPDTDVAQLLETQRHLPRTLSWRPSLGAGVLLAPALARMG